MARHWVADLSRPFSTPIQTVHTSLFTCSRSENPNPGERDVASGPYIYIYIYAVSGAIDVADDCEHVG